MAGRQLAAAAVARRDGLVVVLGYAASLNRRTTPVNGNPQQFHLWSTASNHVGFTFNCDPRASDEWLYRSAAGNLANGNLVATTILAREWDRK